MDPAPAHLDLSAAVAVAVLSANRVSEAGRPTHEGKGQGVRSLPLVHSVLRVAVYPLTFSGSAKATNWSPLLVASLPPPPAAMTTNWRPLTM